MIKKVLRRYLQPALKKVSMNEYRGKTIGIEGNAWLNKIATKYAEDLFYNRQVEGQADDFISKIRILVDLEIKPVVVFDGDSLKAREKKDMRRNNKKAEVRKQIEAMLAAGNNEEAISLMSKCVSITKSFLRPVLLLLKKEKFEFMFAPYEAKAQLVYLQKIKYIHSIITDDYSLPVFGASNILFRYRWKKYAYEFKISRLIVVKGNFFKENMVDIVIMSGCDYLRGLPGLGVRKALRLLQKYKTVERCASHLESKVKRIPKNYMKKFLFAKLNFRCQIIWDPVQLKRDYLNYPDNLKDPNLANLGIIDYPNAVDFANGLTIL